MEQVMFPFFTRYLLPGILITTGDRLMHHVRGTRLDLANSSELNDRPCSVHTDTLSLYSRSSAGSVTCGWGQQQWGGSVTEYVPGDIWRSRGLDCPSVPGFWT